MRTPYPNELMHYGIPGMRKGVRRWQNEDGSLTAAGRQRYLDGNDRRENAPINRTASGNLQAARTSFLTGREAARQGDRAGARQMTAQGQRQLATARSQAARSSRSSRSARRADLNGRKLNQQWDKKPVNQEHKSRNLVTGNTHRWNNVYGTGSRTVERNGQWVDYDPFSGEASGVLSNISDYKAFNAENHARDAWNASQQAARSDSKVARQNARTIRQMQASTAFKKASSAVKSTASSAVKSLTSWASGLFGRKKKG